MALLLILAVVISFVISTMFAKKIANKVYILTGYNGFSDLHKTLCASILIILVVVSIIAPDNTSLGFLSLVPVIILAVLNLKAKDPKYIVILTITQTLYGISWFFFFLLKIFFNIVLKTNFNLFNVELKPLRDATLERANFIAKEKNYIDANDWAQKEGNYPDANAAYESGFFVNKLY